MFCWLQITRGQKAENAVAKLIENTTSMDDLALRGFATTEISKQIKIGGIAAEVLVA